MPSPPMNESERRADSSDQPRRGRISTAALVAALAALAILPYLNALRAGFVFDDHYLVEKHVAVHGPFSIARVLTSSYWGELQGAMLWRPMTTLSFAIDQRIGGGHAAWFHLVNVLLHAAVTILWAILILRLTRRAAMAFVAGALFAVHPIHTEAVTWVSGRAELLAAAFGLAALHLAIAADGPRGRAAAWARWLAPVAVLFAIGSKESAATIPLVILWIGLTFGRAPLEGASTGDRPRRIAPSIIFACFVPLILYVVARRAVLGAWAGPVPDPMDNPMIGTGLFARIPTVLECAGRYIFLVLWPARLSVDYSFPVIRVVRGVTPLLILGTVTGAALAWLAIRRRGTPEGFGAAFAILTFALASNLPVVIGTVFAERLFYLPSAGVLLVIAAGATAVLATSRERTRAARPGSRAPVRALQAALALVLVAGAVRTWIRNGDYRDEDTLYSTGARIMPQSPKMRYNHALVLDKRGQHEEALREVVEAIRLNPSSRESRKILASSLDSLGRTEEAIRSLRGFLALDPKDHDTRRTLINLLTKVGRKAQADSVAEAGMVEEPEFPEWIGRSARAAQESGDYARAIPLWREARARAPDAVDVALGLAFSLLASGDARAACDAYREAARLAPQSSVAANGLAWSILESDGNPAEAVSYAERAASADPTASNLDTLARALIAAGRCDEAATAAGKAVALAPEQASYRARLDQARRCARQ